jgi:hypothetical protein
MNAMYLIPKTARNTFTGTVPTTSVMLNLRLIDLQHNRIEKENICTTDTAAEKGFTGNLPDILTTEGSRVEVAALNNNCFSGEITGRIRFSSHLKYLDLRNNNLNGTLPQQIKQCLQLKVLLLSGNPNLDLAAIPNGVKRFLRDMQVKIDFPLGTICQQGTQQDCVPED